MFALGIFPSRGSSVRFSWQNRTRSSEQAEIFFLGKIASLLSWSICILRFWNSFSRCEIADWPYISPFCKRPTTQNWKWRSQNSNSAKMARAGYHSNGCWPAVLCWNRWLVYSSAGWYKTEIAQISLFDCRLKTRFRFPP